MSERVLLLQLDGHENYDEERPGLPNLACLRIAGHHRERGDEVVFRCVGDGEDALDSNARWLWGAPEQFDRVYASTIFAKTRKRAERVLALYPRALVGGTGWSVTLKLSEHGIDERGPLDWSIYPHERRSVGFSQRGCRLKCGFCVVPQKEGRVREADTIAGLWRGDPFPRDLVLLDNDFFGQPRWRDRVREILDGGFRVSLTQGINARLVGDEEAEALASLPYFDDSFEKRRLYCAWDNAKDGKRLFAGLERLKAAGVRPSHLMVYVLVGYDHATGAPCSLRPEDFDRVRRLREWGADIYPMPFERTPELMGFQRWAHKGYDKRVPWPEWVAARFQPRNLVEREPDQIRLFSAVGSSPPLTFRSASSPTASAPSSPSSSGMSPG